MRSYFWNNIYKEVYKTQSYLGVGLVSEFEKGWSKSLECESTHKLLILSISLSDMGSK